MRHKIRAVLAVIVLLWAFAALWSWALFGMAAEVGAAHFVSVGVLIIILCDPSWKDRR